MWCSKGPLHVALTPRHRRKVLQLLPRTQDLLSSHNILQGLQLFRKRITRVSRPVKLPWYYWHPLSKSKLCPTWLSSTAVETCAYFVVVCQGTHQKRRKKGLGWAARKKISEKEVIQSWLKFLVEKNTGAFALVHLVNRFTFRPWKPSWNVWTLKRRGERCYLYSTIGAGFVSLKLRLECIEGHVFYS